MTPIPPYTPKGGGGGGTPAKPSFDISYNSAGNYLEVTSDGNLSGITNMELYTSVDDGPEPNYSSFSAPYVLTHIDDHTLRVTRAYQYFFAYEPEPHEYTFEYGELWSAGIDEPDFIYAGDAVTVDNLASADPITVTLDPFGGGLTVEYQDPVSMADIRYITVVTDGNAFYGTNIDDWFPLDEHTMQLFDVSQFAGQTIIALEFTQEDQQVIPYTWIGSVPVP